MPWNVIDLTFPILTSARIAVVPGDSPARAAHSCRSGSSGRRTPSRTPARDRGRSSGSPSLTRPAPACVGVSSSTVSDDSVHVLEHSRSSVGRMSVPVLASSARLIQRLTSTTRRGGQKTPDADARVNCWSAVEAKTFLVTAKAAVAQAAAVYTVAIDSGARTGRALWAVVGTRRFRQRRHSHRSTALSNGPGPIPGRPSQSYGASTPAPDRAARCDVQFGTDELQCSSPSFSLWTPIPDLI